MKLKVFAFALCFLSLSAFDRVNYQSLDSFIGTAPNKKSAKIDYYSKMFLGAKYAESPLGEGAEGKYDRDPLYRFDEFDCVTFVETVLALSISESRSDFKTNMNNIRYKGGVVDFMQRNHFMVADWIPNNSYILKDVTKFVGGENVKTLSFTTNRVEWFKKMYGINLSGAGINLEKTVDVKVDYIPLNMLDTSKIPSGAIVNIVRPDKKVKSVIGTNIAVFHTGFAIKSDGKLFFRHSSLNHGKVIDEEWNKYFAKYGENDGINILVLK